MFIIGLELNPAKLWQLRRSIFGVGAAQVMLSAVVLAGLLMLTAFSWQAAVVGGIGLAMSSTAMALQLMREKGMNRSESGQLGFSVLLFQDLAVIPALALVPLLAGSADEHFDWIKVTGPIPNLDANGTAATAAKRNNTPAVNKSEPSISGLPQGSDSPASHHTLSHGCPAPASFAFWPSKQ